MNHESTHSMRDACHRTGITPRAIRFWEQKGLLSKMPRTHGNHRHLTDAHLKEIEAIIFLKRAGYALRDIIDGNLVRKVLSKNRDIINTAVSMAEEKLKRADADWTAVRAYAARHR